MATIWLLPNTQHVRFEEIAHLIALALYPESRKLEATEMERLEYFGAMANLAPELKHAVRSGVLQPKDPLTHGPHSFPIGQALKDALIAVDNLRTYVADRSIEVKEMLIFKTLARPLGVDLRLAAMSPYDHVVIVDNLAGQSGNGIGSAGDYREQIASTMARQAEGFFTIDEAAQVLADTYPALEVKDLVNRMRIAQRNGKLLVRNSDHLPMNEGDMFRSYKGMVSASDLNAWLNEFQAGYRFPDGQQPTAQAGIVPVQRMVAQETAILEKLSELGYQATSLPRIRQGKSGVKAQVKQALGKNGLWANSTVFDKAWDRLRQDRRIGEQTP